MFQLAIFSGTKIDGRAIHPGEHVVALSLFGGIEFDFTEAPAPPGVDLTLIAIFGGAVVRIRPQDEVELSGLSIFGGRSIENERQRWWHRFSPTDDPSWDDPRIGPPLGIDAYAVFGGVVVKRAVL